MNSPTTPLDNFEHAETKMTERYLRAQQFMQAANGGKKLAINTTLVPYWITGTECFWYVRETWNGHGVNKHYRLVNAAATSNTAAFDHEALAEALASTSGEAVIANNLPLENVEFNLSDNTVCFDAFNARWIFDDRHHCEKIDAIPACSKLSPDGKMAAFARDNNLWILDLTTGKERALTNDGGEFHCYSGTSTVMGYKQSSSCDFIWSPDSTRLLTQLIDTRDLSVGIPMVDHVPSDGSLKPVLHRANRRRAFYTDEKREVWKILSIEVQTGNIQYANHDGCLVSYPQYKGYFEANRGFWAADSRYGYFIDQESDGRQTRVLKFDTHNGLVETLIAEEPEFCASIIPAMHWSTLMKALPASKELIWSSERSGWMHLYLYDLESGTLKNPITQGEWLVRNILYFDQDKRELIIQTAGRTQDRNPYYRDICRVNIDTGHLSTLLSTDHEYVVADNGDSYMFNGLSAPQSSGVSPSGRLIVTTRSRVDDLPVNLLLDGHDGRELMVLETADVSAMPKGWQWPEVTLVKGSDNTTDIHAVIFRPPNFNPENSYPVLDLSFSFTEPAGSFTNNAQAGFQYLSALAYAELGFIVVKFTHRGDLLGCNGAGVRHRAFGEFRDTSLPAHNLSDCVAGIRQLCERYSFMDGERVGVSDYISTSTALTGMLIYPELYKVGVSVNLGDHRTHPIDRFGVREHDPFPSLEDFADKLHGKLLLIHGMMDEALPVSNTLRVVAALEKANKNFDMLLLPTGGHGGSPYGMRRGWDYLVEHLLGEKPPENFKFSYFS